MSWHFSLALVEDYLQASCLDGELFAPLKSTTTPAAYCWRDKTTESLNLFQYGMTLNPLTRNLGRDLLTWFREAFHVPTSASPAPCGDAPGLTENKAAYGGTCSASSTKAKPPASSRRTPPNSPEMDSTKSFTPFPSAGFYAAGLLLALETADCHTNENACGYSLPTPTARDWKDTPGMNPTRSDGKTRLDRLPMLLFSCVRSAGIQWKQMTATAAQTVSVKALKVTIAGKSYCPDLPEWLMGWPIGWSDLKPLETAKFQSWLSALGRY